MKGHHLDLSDLLLAIATTIILIASAITLYNL